MGNLLWEENNELISIPATHSLLDAQTLKLIISGLIRRTLNDRIIPIDVLSLCCEYFPYEFSCLSDLKNEGPFADQIIINDSNEYLFRSLDLHQTAITGNASILKLGVAHDLTLDADSDISCRSEGGSIFLNIGGDVLLKKDSVIQSRRNGNIYIKCTSMTIEENAMIRTHHHSAFTASTLTTNPMAISRHLNGDNMDTMYGNIRIIVEDELCICPGVQIQSGNVHIDCRGTLKVNYSTDLSAKQSAQITAFRDCLRIDAMRFYSPWTEEEQLLLFTAMNRMEIEYGDHLQEDWDPEAQVIDVVVEGLLEDGVGIQSQSSSSLSSVSEDIVQRAINQEHRLSRLSGVGLGYDMSDDEDTDNMPDIDADLREHSASFSGSRSNSSFKRQSLKITIGS